MACESQRRQKSKSKDHRFRKADHRRSRSYDRWRYRRGSGILGTRRDHYRGNGRGRSYHEKTCTLYIWPALWNEQRQGSRKRKRRFPEVTWRNELHRTVRVRLWLSLWPQWPYRTTVRKTLYTSDVRTGICRTFQHGRDSWGCQGKSKIRTASGCSFFLWAYDLYPIRGYYTDGTSGWCRCRHACYPGRKSNLYGKRSHRHWKIILLAVKIWRKDRCRTLFLPCFP